MTAPRRSAVAIEIGLVAGPLASMAARVSRIGASATRPAGHGEIGAASRAAPVGWAFVGLALAGGLGLGLIPVMFHRYAMREALAGQIDGLTLSLLSLALSLALLLLLVLAGRQFRHDGDLPGGHRSR